jgi:AhpD family alkylhydroperoxidase
MARLTMPAAAPATYKALRGVEDAIAASGLEKRLIELVKMRASQINGCGFCLDMHAADARAAGETEQRLYVLSGWRESSLYTDRERAALAWTDSLTRVADKGAPDAEYDELRRHFSEAEIANLTALAGMINLWNRVAVGFAMHPRARA